MAIINRHLLTTVTDDVLMLTPNDLLHMKSSVILPMPSTFDGTDVYARKIWVRVQGLVDLFWSRWVKEYSHQMQTGSKWRGPSRNVQLGDIVILSDESSRAHWAEW